MYSDHSSISPYSHFQSASVWYCKDVVALQEPVMTVADAQEVELHNLTAAGSEGGKIESGQCRITASE
jgi:hypothetical protein